MEFKGIELRDEAVRDRIRQAIEFLDPSDPRKTSLRSDIVSMLNRGERRLNVSLDDIRNHSKELANGILFQPFDFAPAFDQALKQVISTLPDRAPYEQDEDRMYYTAYNGSFGENACNPRTLNSSLLNRMICLEGIVTRCSLVRPKVTRSVHWNEKKSLFQSREYRDQTMSASKPGSTSVYPQTDSEGNTVSNYNHSLCLAVSNPVHSFKQNMDTRSTATIRPYQSKRCLNEHLRVNSPVA
jgi:DNA replication licensing factor MCM3